MDSMGLSLRPQDTKQESITLIPEFGVDPKEGEDHYILITTTFWSS